MHFFLPFTLAVDSRVNTPKQSVSEMQDTLMRHFFASITPRGRMEFSENRPNQHNVLDWKGITCTEGQVRAVRYHTKKVGNFYIQFLPHSTRQILIADCRQRYSIDTRMLPQNLTSFSMYQNSLFGTVNLTVLPIHLEEFVAFENELIGSIDITKLPRKMNVLNLTFNNIYQRIVLYGNLPSNIEAIWIDHQADRGIKGVRAILEDDRMDNGSARKLFGKVRNYPPYKEDEKNR
mmetsp:Transcript_9272/g.14062  ORF Transcript_9272/g.14062 Transcript_9272/m.14062 type:complete len:234 (-) Transcript_9272:98-799(-)